MLWTKVPQTGGTCIASCSSDGSACRLKLPCQHSVMQALIKPTRSEKHPRVMVSMDWTDLLPRSEIVRALTRCCCCASAAILHHNQDCQKCVLDMLCKSVMRSWQVAEDWMAPMPQVHWEFWSNANDMCGPVCDVQKSFMKASPAVSCPLKQTKPAALITRGCLNCGACATTAASARRAGLPGRRRGNAAGGTRQSTPAF